MLLSCSGGLYAHLDDVYPGEIAPQAMERPIGERQLQQPKQAVEGIVDRHHLAEILEAKQRAKDGVVGGVQEVAAAAPHYECDSL